MLELVLACTESCFRSTQIFEVGNGVPGFSRVEKPSWSSDALQRWSYLCRASVGDCFRAGEVVGGDGIVQLHK
jgi:hypothetical protein